MGEKIFPLKAKKDGSILSGSFKSADDSYDFTAMISGRDMKLSSGGNNYALKKASNPLDKPKKPNPLGSQTGAASEANKTRLSENVQGSGRSPEHGSANVLRFQLYSLKDDKVIPGEAATFLIPAGWRVTGGIQWRPHIYYPTFVDLQIRDPAGVDAMCLLPTVPCCWPSQPMFGFQEGSLYAGNLVKRPCAPADFIRQIVLPYLRKDLQAAQIVKTEELPDVAKSALAGNAPEAGIQKSAQAVKVRFRYDEGGVPIEEDVYCRTGLWRWPADDIFQPRHLFHVPLQSGNVGREGTDSEGDSVFGASESELVQPT